MTSPQYVPGAAGHHRIADEPRIAHDLHLQRMARQDASTEARDRAFIATRGSRWGPRRRMIWSDRLGRFVWWERSYEGKWAPQGVTDRALARKLRVEVADAHDARLRTARRAGLVLPSPEEEGASVEEILDVLDELDARELRDRDDEDRSDEGGE